MKPSLKFIQVPVILISMLTGCAMTGSGIQQVQLRLGIPSANRWPGQAVYPRPEIPEATPTPKLGARSMAPL